MKQKFYIFLPVLIFLNAFFISNAKATPQITLTTSSLAATDINQGTSGVIVYAVKMKVSTDPVTVNNIQFTLSGTYDNNDINTLYIYYNPTSPVISGASYLGSAAATYASPHAYSININRSLAVGEAGYFIIVANINNTATDNHTVQINGSTDPVVFGYTVTTNVTNSQSNNANKQTIQASDITLTTSTVAAANYNQGTTGVIVYAVKMKVSTEPLTVNNIQFVLSGNYDNDDLTTLYIYYNPTSPVISGASYLGSSAATYTSPHTYNININRSLAVGEAGYFIIVANINNAATDNHNIQVNGGTDPVVFGFTTSPNITNSQSNKADKQTIQASDITLTTSTVAAANYNQGTTGVIVYAVKMKVNTEPLTVNNIQFVLSGNYDNDDLTTLYIYYNATSPVISGASYLGSSAATYTSPHTYSININRALAVGEAGYFIIVANINNVATDNHNIQVNGGTNPVVFGFTTSPNVTNSQTNKADKQTIQASDITLTTSTVAAANYNQGTTGVIVYAVKMKVSTEPVTVNNIDFTLSGNYDNNDLTTLYIYYNATSPVISGASYLGSSVATYTSPHTYSININRALAVGEAGYFIIVANISSTATDNHNILINGSTDPVVFGYTTSPNITNSQGNKAAKQTIQAADITITSENISAGNILRSSTGNIVYAAKMKASTEPVTVNNIDFTLSGSHDNDDLVSIYIYYNPTSPVISGASYLGSAAATYAAPHTYSININRALAAGETGYFLITANVSSAATFGNTVKINGATDPVVFGYTTDPNITDNQTNSAGTKTIAASLTKSIKTNEELFASANKSVVLSSVFPNPVNTSFNFSISGNENAIVKAQLVTRLGNILLQKNLVMNKGLNQYNMTVSSLMSGVYYLIITNGSGIVIAKQQVVVQH